MLEPLTEIPADQPEGRHDDLKERLQNEKTLTREILEGAVTSYWEWYPEENRGEFSPGFARALGYPGQTRQMTREEWMSLLEPDDVPRANMAMRNHITSGGRMPYKIEVRYAQMDNWQASFEFNFGREVDIDYTHLLKQLRDIDTVVFVGGLSSQLEGEEMSVTYPGFKGGDRTDIELPDAQRNCLKMLKDAGKKIIYVNCSGSALALTPETQTCDAILQAWYPGESGGLAVADVLFGDCNPAGKLPVTFYKSSKQLPDIENYAMKGRTYRFMSDALFPFGFGLSYNTFNIGTATFSRKQIENNESLELTIPVTNTGKRDGTEIVQVYVRKQQDADGPLKTLKGFERVHVAAGKTSQAVINIPRSSFEFFDWPSGKMMVTPGEYEVMYGASSDPKDLKVEKIVIR